MEHSPTNPFPLQADKNKCIKCSTCPGVHSPGLQGVSDQTKCLVQPVQPIIKYQTASIVQLLLVSPLPPPSNRTVNIILNLVNHRRAQLRRVLCIPKINIIPGIEFKELERWLNYQLPIQILRRPNFKNLSCLAELPKLLPIQF